VARHDSLRTGFELQGDEPVLVVHDRIDATLSVIDAPESTLEAVVKSCITDFDLARPPLVRLSLVNTADGRALVVDAHHIAIDGASVDVLLHELAAAYEGVHLPPPAQYRDYIAWRELRDRDAVAAFWREQLTALSPPLELPIDAPRPAVRDHKGRSIIHRVPVAGIQALARERRATTFMVLLAAYHAWLYRVTGQGDAIVGVASSTRDPALHADLVWLTATTLVLRARTSGEMRFGELLDAVRSTCLAAYANADYPFERLIEHLRAARGPSRHPIDAMLSYEKPRARVLEIGGVRGTQFDVEKRGVECDVDVDMVELDGVVEIQFTFATALFREETMQRLSRAYVEILDAAVAHPDERLLDLALPGLQSPR
jgi:hypothetical protein